MREFESVKLSRRHEDPCLNRSNSLARISTLVVQESAGVSMRVKDGLREQCIPAVVDAWAAILEVPPPPTTGP